MKYSVKRPFRWLCCALLAATAFTSCDMMEEDLSDCAYGLYVTFKYDYNLERADMFNDHVGSVTLYAFDEDGKLVMTQEESNTDGVAPLKDKTYTMHVTTLNPGKYKFIALAGQRPYADMLADSRARFVRTDMAQGDDMTELGIQLDRTPRGGTDTYDIINNGLPLDTLWHGMLMEPVEVFSYESNRPSYATIPLVRDTKKINVTLYQTDDPWTMDIANYDMTITDRNSTLLWDNAVDESTGTVVYTPHATWNTEHENTVDQNQDPEPLGRVGRIGHADFMTSRFVYHTTTNGRGDVVADASQNARLSIVNRKTGIEVVAVDLPDLLSKLRTSEDRYRYTEQEFLDRGYDYDVNIYLVGDKLNFIQIGIGVLGWTKRVQDEELE